MTTDLTYDEQQWADRADAEEDQDFLLGEWLAGAWV